MIEQTIFTTTKEEPSFIFIDGSYFCYNRYFSVLRWWKLSHPDEPMITNPIEHTLFKAKFIQTFLNSVNGLSRNINIQDTQHKINDSIMFVGKDCKREDIWRNSIQDKYKGTRISKEGFGAFIKMVYEDKLFGKATILEHPELEADDCIALSVKHLLKTHEKCRIYIMTSDKDYLQLVEPRVKIFNLSFKNIAEQKSCLGDAKTDLFCKIIMGDVSDNIPSVLKKCGPKTALKCYQNPDYFKNRMNTEDAHEKFAKNQKMIDFNCIPDKLVAEFYKMVGL